MRNINIPIEVIENVTVEKIATKERIVEYTVNNKSAYISVKTELLSDDELVVGQEDFYFGGTQFKVNPSEYDLWQMIDEERETS